MGQAWLDGEAASPPNTGAGVSGSYWDRSWGRGCCHGEEEEGPNGGIHSSAEEAVTFEKQSSLPAAIYPVFPEAPAAEHNPECVGQAGQCWAALGLSCSSPLSKGGSDLRS